MKKIPLKPEDLSLWQALAKTVTPLKGKEIAPEIIEEVPQEPAFSPSNIPSQVTSRIEAVKDLEVNQTRGIDKHFTRKIQKGQVAFQARLDLHGMIQEKAFKILSRFLQESYHLNYRCVLVITGKGKNLEGTLRVNLPRWLNNPTLKPMILNISEAHLKDGGQGAYYIHLKRRK